MTTTIPAAAPALREGRAALAAADDQIIAAVRARAQLAAADRAARRAEPGGTERDLPGEDATVRHYRETLEPDLGTELAAELAAVVLRASYSRAGR
jgi:hypothetical protein